MVSGSLSGSAMNAVTPIASLRFGAVGVSATPVTVGAKFRTCIVTVLGVDDRVPSVTVSVKVRSPSVAGVVKDGFGVFAFWSVTVVPDVCCHWNVSGPPLEWETEALRETGVRFDVVMSGPALATGGTVTPDPATLIVSVAAAEFTSPSLTTRENVSAPETPGAVNVGFGLETLLRTTEVPPV